MPAPNGYHKRLVLPTRDTQKAIHPRPQWILELNITFICCNRRLKIYAIICI